MKLFEGPGFLATMRSWSLPPPPYEDEASAEPHRPLPRRATIRSHMRLSTWLLTFEKQWLLIHALSVFACFALMFTGAALFVTAGFGTSFDEIHRVWLAGAVGMFGLAASVASFRYLLQMYDSNPSQTQEQQRMNKFLATIFAALAQTFIAVIYIAIAHTTPDPSRKLRLVRAVATVAAILCSMAGVYDIIRMCRDGRDRIEADYWHDHDIADDAIGPDDVNIASVRLD